MVTYPEDNLVVYIGGYGRSGSTLLEILLSKVMGSVGELRYFPRHVVERKIKCGCGRRFEECPVWSEVLKSYTGRKRRRELTRLQELFLSEEGWLGLFRLLLRTDWHNFREYRDTLRRFYSSVFLSIGKRIIVESSKTARGARARPALLKEICGIEVKLIHLTRDPRGVYYSLLKGSNERIEAGDDPAMSFTAFRATVGWMLANIACYINRILVGKRNYLCVKYEDIVSCPIEVLKRIGRFLSIDMTPVTKGIMNGEYFISEHIVGGNRMARNTKIQIRPESSWPEAFPRLKQIVIWLSVWPIALLNGYPLFVKASNLHPPA